MLSVWQDQEERGDIRGDRSVGIWRRREWRWRYLSVCPDGNLYSDRMICLVLRLRTMLYTSLIAVRAHLPSQTARSFPNNPHNTTQHVGSQTRNLGRINTPNAVSNEISYTHLFIPPYFRAKTLVLYRKNGKRIYMNGGTGTTQANKPMWNRDIRGRWVSHTPRLGRERGLKKRKKNSCLTHHLWGV